MTRGVSPWRALAQSGISLKWEDPRTTWSGCMKRNPRPSGRGVCQKGETYKLVKVTSVTSPEVTETYYSLMHKEIGNVIEVNVKELQ